MAGVYKASSYIVSYVGRWAYPQLEDHICEFWTETPAGPFPLIELSAVNGNVFISMVEAFRENTYYEAFLEELKENNLSYREYGKDLVMVAEMKASLL